MKIKSLIFIPPAGHCHRNTELFALLMLLALSEKDKAANAGMTREELLKDLF
ncbi:hypothetical protein QMZ30_15435 [Pantoea sp. EA-12]|uniref:hypothetical protein n=1 Tax=Pantoea sp. EA-12 TaxID=3043303 RepID=UPI0024B621B4|nr:hypothetical protein [Pantoea sp. EA-12]MDI9222299.1 hypothetical protein [Pantoea sp. EA-12]